jgi:hypothetical protein
VRKKWVSGFHSQKVGVWLSLWLSGPTPVCIAGDRYRRVLFARIVNAVYREFVDMAEQKVANEAAI